MTEKQTDARLRILAAAAGLIAEASQAGLVVTIATTPKQPLAMGHCKMAISVRDKRGAPAPSAEAGQEVDDAPAAPDARDLRIAVLEDALRFYAKGDHFGLSDKDAWDTVSGEPQNWWCDEAGTATIEDGTLAALALKGTPLLDEEEQDQPPRPGTAPLSDEQAMEIVSAAMREHGVAFTGRGLFCAVAIAKTAVGHPTTPTATEAPHGQPT